MNTDRTGFNTRKECHKTESLWNHTNTDHKEEEQLEDRRSVGGSSCNSGDGTGQSVLSLMLMMMMKGTEVNNAHTAISRKEATPAFEIITNINLWNAVRFCTGIICTYLNWRKCRLVVEQNCLLHNRIMEEKSILFEPYWDWFLITFGVFEKISQIEMNAVLKLAIREGIADCMCLVHLLKLYVFQLARRLCIFCKE